MKTNKTLKVLSMLGLCAALLTAEGVPAYAGHIKSRRPKVERKTVKVKRAPRGRPFRWHRKGFYRRPGGSGLWIDLPIGKIVIRLPLGYRRIVYRGRPYFYCDGIYYAHSPRGYVIVEPPYTCCSDRISEKVTIYIPNANGSFTAVELTRSGSGYIGPQGEYYPDQPTVDQLAVLYGK